MLDFSGHAADHLIGGDATAAEQALCYAATTFGGAGAGFHVGTVPAPADCGAAADHASQHIEILESAAVVRVALASQCRLNPCQ